MLCTDPEAWQNSNLYDPGRFLRAVPKQHYIPFSAGTHACPGQQVAMYYLKTILCMLLLQYDFELPDREPDLSFERATLAQRKSSYLIHYTRKRTNPTFLKQIINN